MGEAERKAGTFGRPAVGGVTASAERNGNCPPRPLTLVAGIADRAARAFIDFAFHRR
jgi:hypothetical protein